jgi:hypothetical protein
MAIKKQIQPVLEGLLWVVDQPTPGQKWTSVELDWNVTLSKDERLGDVRHRRLLEELQAFLRLALTKPTSAVRVKPGSLYSTFTGLVELARFMRNRNLTSISQVTSQESWEFVEFFRSQYKAGSADVGRPRGVTFASALKVLHCLTQIHAIRIPLRDAGFATLPEAPYSGMSTFAVVTNYLKFERPKPHKPIPDHIAVPTLSRAASWVLEGGADVVEIQRLVLELMRDSGLNKRAARSRITKMITAYTFKKDVRTGHPWMEQIRARDRLTPDGGRWRLTPFQSTRRLILDMVAACITLIQGATGMRAHELIGLRAVRREDGSLQCVESELSADGLMEVFYLRGITAKRQAETHRWTAGLRPTGVDELPLPVVAVNVLADLLDPWRTLAGDDHLLLTFRTRKSFPGRRNAVGRFVSDTLTRVQREFALDALLEAGYGEEEAVAMSMEIRGQRWRTTFAHAVFRTSPALISALRDHFRHISELVTDQGYIGSDASLLDDLESERIQSTARTFLQMATGKRLGAGTVQRLITRHKEQLMAEISEMPGDGDLARAIAYVMVNDVRIWTGRYASCLINLLPNASRCNKYASLSPGFATPDYANRSPSVCASCNCCIILPEHREFWTDRLATNLRIVEAEEEDGLHRTSRSIAAKRVAQSRAILRAIDSLHEPTGDVPSGASS